MGIFSREKRMTATIRRIWHNPPPGAPWYYWTFVLFESRGDSVQIKLTARQAKKFVKTSSEGETGHLVYAGKSLVSWEKASDVKPLKPRSDVNVFLSYAHEWSDDAEYIGQVFRSYGLSVWLDTSSLKTGDKLDREVLNAIENAHYFVSLLSPEYFASPWCIKEMETAGKSGIDILPIKVSTGKLAIPPHLRKFYQQTLGDPVFLDIRKRDPSIKLGELSEQMLKR
jgi:hypothetical protein